jgi:hypothetical protein
MLNKDNIRLGFILGMVAPILGIFIYYFISFLPHHVTFREYLGFLRQYKTILTGVTSISLVANAILFTVYVNLRKDRTIKGIFIATLLYGLGVLLIKFFL